MRLIVAILGKRDHSSKPTRWEPHIKSLDGDSGYLSSSTLIRLYQDG
jgi:hypothetical protein